jgi:tetratricopeptide (TPR) repeat protein
LVAGCATWLLAACYTAWWALRCDPERHRAEIERLYRESLSCYLKGEWRGARLLCEQVLARDETDAEALFHLGLVHVRLNQFELARRAFRQCLESAGGTTWRWEIERELERIKHLTIPSN